MAGAPTPGPGGGFNAASFGGTSDNTDDTRNVETPDTGNSGQNQQTITVLDDQTTSAGESTNETIDQGKPYKLPSDATWHQVGEDIIVVFIVTLPGSSVPPMTITYVVDPEYKDRFDFSNAKDGGKLSSTSFDAKYENPIEAGDALELTGIEEETYAEWFEESFKMLVGYNPIVLSDPEIANLFVEAIAGDWSESQIQTRLETTAYWQETNQTARTWDQSSPADQQRLIDTQMGNLSQAFRGFNSRLPTKDEANDLVELSQKVASGQITYGQASNELFETAAKDEDTPAAASMREYNRHDISIEDKVGDLRNQANSWGVTVSDKDLNAWGQKVVDLDASQEDYDGFLKDLAESNWGSREAGTSNRARDVAVSQWASGYTSTYQELMEVAGDQTSMLFDGGFQDAFDPQATLGDFRKTLRRTDKWKETDNGRAEISGRMAGLGRMMGYS